MAGGVRVPVTLRAPDFRLDVDRLRAAVTAATRLILLNTPHNPTGTVLTDARAARRWPTLAVERDLRRGHRRGLRAHGVRRRAPSRSPTLPGMRERTLTISSAGKTFSFTGWKIGWATGPAAPGARGADGQAVPDLRVRRAVPAGGRGRRCGCRTPTSTSCRATLRASGTGSAPGCARSGSRCSSRPAPTSSPPTSGRSAGDDGVEFCRDLPHAVRRRGDPAPGLLRRRRGRPAAGPVRVLQARRGARRGADPAAVAPFPLTGMIGTRRAAAAVRGGREP